MLVNWLFYSNPGSPNHQQTHSSSAPMQRKVLCQYSANTVFYSQQTHHGNPSAHLNVINKHPLSFYPCPDVKPQRSRAHAFRKAKQSDKSLTADEWKKMNPVCYILPADGSYWNITPSLSPFTQQSAELQTLRWSLMIKLINTAINESVNCWRGWRGRDALLLSRKGLHAHTQNVCQVGCSWGNGN